MGGGRMMGRLFSHIGFFLFFSFFCKGNDEGLT